MNHQNRENTSPQKEADHKYETNTQKFMCVVFCIYLIQFGFMYMTVGVGYKKSFKIQPNKIIKQFYSENIQLSLSVKNLIKA